MDPRLVRAQLGRRNIYHQIEKHMSNSLYISFAPWCPHCQQLEPIFEEAAIRTSKGMQQRVVNVKR